MNEQIVDFELKEKAICPLDESDEEGEIIEGALLTSEDED